MKLKLVVASMSVLGLISCPVFAATQTKHKHHHHHHHVSQQQVVETHDYKAMGALPVVEMPRVDTYQVIYDSMGQNSGRAKGMPDWFNRIGVSGGVNFDAHWGNRSKGYRGENYTRLSLNDAYINFAATVNDWSKAFASISYSNFSAGGAMGGTYSTAYTNNRLNLEQGYVTIANYDVSPVFFQIGKQFTDFSRYNIHPLTRTLTQVISESLATSAKLGFITRMGLHGQIYAFDNAATQTGQGHTRSVYGAALGFDQPSDQLGFDAGIGYMSNLTGVNDVAASLGNPGQFGVSTNSYVHTVGGIALYGDVNSGPFSIGARFTTAIQNFSPVDLSNQFGLATGSGAKPWAADITAGFGYNAWNKNQNVYLGYQTSNNAVNLALPKNRWLAGWNVDMWKSTNLGLEVGHDTAYSSSNGGSGKSSNTIGARAAVKFG
jgi:hypothetical protein